MSPVIPHITNECLNQLDYGNDIKWPEVSKENLEDEKLILVIQINGKKKYTIEVEKDIDEKKATKIINESNLLKKYDNTKFVRTIYVKNRLINYIYN